MHAAIAVAHPNVALVKYWGKRDRVLNLPAVGSISVTLAGLSTVTRVCFDGTLERDEVIVEGLPGGEAGARVAAFLDLVRGMAGVDAHARVESRNDFPTGAGLASSASAFAALALAATRAAGLKLSRRELSILARRGSGSAARSVFGGFVEWHRGERGDGLDAFAEQLLPEDAWPLVVLVAVTSQMPKPVGSTEGMELSRLTSPFWPAWVESAPAMLAAMREAIAARDLARVGELAEHSCLAMHAVAMSARPGLVYWNAATVAAMHAVRELRRAGVEAYFTVDAGPQVKVLAAPGDAGRVREVLGAVPGVERVIDSGPGPEARLYDEARLGRT
ncbi:MAG TPA: diphosphomevalonate decarboxylase [Thermoanaerobaculaceae bacterium]|nr:diphosphomevalonate decarboxylase [Thermoanaerobaculaceae bacterium]HRS16842.1 diphosphomevalonate decarboxylase [Thermoanaerobaculaceae bacterium]